MIYDTKHQMDQAMTLLDNARIMPECKKAIKEFLRDLSVSGIGDHRLLFYSRTLPDIAAVLGGKFMKPDRDSITKLLAEIDGRGYKGWTRQNYRTAVKRFYKWLLGDDEYYPDCVRWIKKLPANQLNGKPEPVITHDEYGRLVMACRTVRDKAMLSLLWDGGMRVSELLSAKVQDWHPDDRGAVIILCGKTGSRRTRIIGDSISYVNQWLTAHPSREPGAPLFPSWQEDGLSEMSYAAFAKRLKEIGERAGVKGRLHPHRFRHSTATRWAGVLSESVLESQLGWVPGSGMSRVYVHMAGKDVDESVLTAAGIEIPKKQKTVRFDVPQRCRRCDRQNPAAAGFCAFCGLPLNQKAAAELKMLTESVESTLLRSRAVSDDTKALISGLPASVKDAALTVLLESIAKDPERIRTVRETYRSEKSE